MQNIKFENKNDKIILFFFKSFYEMLIYAKDEKRTTNANGFNYSLSGFLFSHSILFHCIRRSLIYDEKKRKKVIKIHDGIFFRPFYRHQIVTDPR